MRTAGGILIFAILMILNPYLAGGVFAGKTYRFFDRNRQSLRAAFRWCSGQMLLWGGFQIISVPMIIRERNFHEVVALFLGYSIALALAGAVCDILFCKKRGKFKTVEDEKSRDKAALTLWIVFAVLLLIQLLGAVLMAYEEGDDAFYVATSTITNNADTMYRKVAYTGEASGVDGRHGLAPMPIWVAYLARMTGLPTVSVAQIVVPVALIAMSYSLFFLIGGQLFGLEGTRLPLFMNIMGILVLFGGYSTYSVENFLIVRTAQGKAVLGNCVFPFLFLLFFALMEKIQNGEKMGIRYWLLLAATVTTGCLCSIQGAMLCVVFLGIVGVCAAAGFRKWKFLLPLGCCCAPALFYLALYIVR